jgi:hypothetical protein
MKRDRIGWENPPLLLVIAFEYAGWNSVDWVLEEELEITPASQVWWLMPVILATQEAAIRRIMV